MMGQTHEEPGHGHGRPGQALAGGPGWDMGDQKETTDEAEWDMEKWV